MDVQTRVGDLQKSIYYPSIFYIPYALYPNLSEEILMELEDHEFFNTLGIITELGEVGSFKNKDSFNVMVKPIILKQNIFQLLEMKGHLQKEILNMVINDYWAIVNFWDHIYDWSKDDTAAKTKRKKTFVLPSDAEVDKLLLERILICVFIKYTSY